MLRWAFLTLAAAILLPQAGRAHEDHGMATVDVPQLDTLLTQGLEGVEDTEIILSRVSLPADVTLPLHWHPGEEFAYVLHGEVTLLMPGQPDRTLAAGMAGVVPLRQVHTARARTEGVTLLVFRVHAEGQPERVLVEN